MKIPLLNFRMFVFSYALVIVSPVFAADEIHWTILGQTSVAFDWRGTNAENTIRYGTSAGNYPDTVTAVTPSPLPLSSAGPFWEAKITGLQENTLYHYSIGTGPDHTFHTPLPRGSSGFTVQTAGDISNSQTYPPVTGVMQQVADDKPAFVLVPGDITYADKYGAAVTDIHFNDVMVWSQDAAYMPTWGNHDWGASAGADLGELKGRFVLPNSQTSVGAYSSGGDDWSWFDYGNVRFVTYPDPWATTTGTEWETKAATLMAQAQADSAIDFIVTFGHRPAYSSGHHAGESWIKGTLDKFGDTYSKYVLNINGHSHNYERSYPQHGVIHITSGGGGAALEKETPAAATPDCYWKICPQSSWTAFRHMHRGPVRLRITKTGIQGNFICGPDSKAGQILGDDTCTLGSIVDTFTISTAGPASTPPAPPKNLRIIE